MPWGYSTLLSLKIYCHVERDVRLSRGVVKRRSTPTAQSIVRHLRALESRKPGN